MRNTNMTQLGVSSLCAPRFYGWLLAWQLASISVDVWHDILALIREESPQQEPLRWDRKARFGAETCLAALTSSVVWI
jgi:hypothetical protein